MYSTEIRASAKVLAPIYDRKILQVGKGGSCFLLLLEMTREVNYAVKWRMKAYMREAVCLQALNISTKSNQTP